jgi:hypothetical protein
MQTSLSPTVGLQSGCGQSLNLRSPMGWPHRELCKPRELVEGALRACCVRLVPVLCVLSYCWPVGFGWGQMSRRLTFRFGNLLPRKRLYRLQIIFRSTREKSHYLRDAIVAPDFLALRHFTVSDRRGHLPCAGSNKRAAVSRRIGGNSGPILESSFGTEAQTSHKSTASRKDVSGSRVGTNSWATYPWKPVAAIPRITPSHCTSWVPSSSCRPGTPPVWK